MKLQRLKYTAYLYRLIAMLGIAFMSANQALSLDSVIAFSSDRDNPGGNRDIFEMDVDGSQPRDLTADPMSDDYAPAWYPNGTKIPFFSKCDENPDIYVMDTDGRNVVRLPRNPGWDADPSWSPNGRKIAFESNRNSNLDIYTMDADGKNVVRLTKDTAADANPSWSPDGRKFVFRSKRNENPEIFVMDADGSSPTNLTQNPAFDSVPAWSPGRLAVAPNVGLLTLWAKLKSSQR